MNKILDIFYNEFLKEAQVGNVDAYFRYNILFGSKYDNKFLEGARLYNTIVPILNIKNKELFDKLLIEYVNISLDFYEFNEEIDNEKYKIKQVLAHLFANATFEDFENPILFLDKRIKFFKDSVITNINESFDSESLESKVNISVSKANIVNETPYAVKIKLIGDHGNHDLPTVYVATADNIAYIYAVQNDKNVETSKKIKRLLYKLDDNFDVRNDNYENFDIGNLKDITHSFLLSVNILTGILKRVGIDKLVVPSILPIRWNAKEISQRLRSKKLNYSIEKFNELELEHEIIQKNLTEKLIRTFLRLEYHHSGIELFGLPSELDSSLHLNLNDFDECNNFILDETYKNSQCSKKL